MRAPLFTFAVVTDTHLKPESGDESSPYKVNLLANARARHVVSELKRLRPDFVIHLGDLVHPLPSLPTYDAAAAFAKKLFGELDCPVHWTAGNHDVGDKPLDWMPAAKADQKAVERFRAHFGMDYSSFDHAGCHFVLLNDCILNTGAACEAEQRAWAEADLAAHAGKRLFLCVHYPPYMLDPREPGNYDNVDEPGRGWLLELAKKHRAEALFAGHVHNFGYDRFFETDYYRLPAVSFVRHDYAEFARIAPAPETEGGRDDRGKFGFLTVKVYEKGQGHSVHLVRTDGCTLEPNEAPPPARLPARHPAAQGCAWAGLHLRHPWNEIVDLPCNGPLDEFARKRLRNDYPLMLLWEWGVRDLRVPAADLLDAATRERMRALARLGQRFTVFSYGAPDAALCAALSENAGLVETWELIALRKTAAQVLASAAQVKRRVPGLRLALSPLETAEDRHTEGSKFSHFSNHGFRTDDSAALDAFLKSAGDIKDLDALVFRLPLAVSAWDGVLAADAAARRHGKQAAVTVQLATDAMAAPNFDHALNAARVAEAVVAGAAHDNARVFLDTFIDHDRGYFMRYGLADRRFNPHPAGAVLGHLQQALDEEANGGAGAWAAASEGVWRLDRGGRQLYLVLSLPRKGVPSQAGTCIDLVEGVRRPFGAASTCEGPALVVLG